MTKFSGLTIKQSGWVWLWLTIILLIADQASKYWANTALAPVFGGPTIEVLPHFDFNLAYNYGAAFSFLSDSGGWQRWFFTAIALGISCVLLFWMRGMPSNRKLANIGMALVLSGAIGNLLDRLIYGYVIDFIDWYIAKDGYHWPTFNIADSVILMGVTLMLIDSFKNPEPKKDNDKK